MTPGTVVSAVTNQARENRQGLIAPIYQPDPPSTTLATRTDTPTLALPASGPDALQAPAEFAAVRADNTKQIARSNYWGEIASIMRWCTTGLIGLTGLAVVNSASTVWGGVSVANITLPLVAEGLGVALASGAVWAALGGFAIMAFATIKASQFSRKLLAEKTFDVQETFVQRQASLINHSVEQSVSQSLNHSHQSSGKSWVERATATASLDPAEAQQASR